MDKIVSRHDSILLVMKQEKADRLLPELEIAINQYNVSIVVENSSINGIVRFQTLLPCLVLIDNDISDMVGLSAAAIIKEAVLKEQYACAVYVTGVTTFLENIRADRIFSDLEVASNKIVIASVRAYLENRINHMSRSEEIKRAKNNQRDIIPMPATEDKFEIIPIFSPFHELSGDGIDYWYDETTNKISGFVFDCTGHDLVSYLQSGEIRAMLKGAWKFYSVGFYKQLSDVMKYANDSLFDLYHEKCVPVAAVIFEFDLNNKTLRICPAGIPNYLIKRQGEDKREEVALSSFLLGFLEVSTYETLTVSIDDLEEVIFSTDGFSELLKINQAGGPPRPRAKHDDVSAVLVRLKNI